MLNGHSIVRRLTAVTAAALAAAAPLALSGATSAEAATTLTAANFRLAKTATASTAIGKLDTALPNVTVPTVLANVNRDMNPCASGLPQAVKSWCWQSDDANTTAWYPQGVSSSADAYTEATYEGKEVLLTSWYDHDDTDGIDKGTRISFIDTSNPADPNYRHVLLVEPYVRSDGKASFRAVPVHAGGIAWYGYYLYVADTWNGLRVFDMRHLWEVSTGDTTKIGLQGDGTYQAFDYKYVLPQAFSYDASTAGGYPAFRHSSVALDRTSTPDSIVMTEYRNSTDQANGQKARVVRFPIDYTNRLLTTGTDGLAHASQAYDVDTNSLQGGIAVNGKFYFSQSDGDANNGDLLRFTPANTLAWYYDDLPVGTEDLSYWGPRDELWTVGEHPGQRSVVAVRMSAYTG